jgi:hypothetical protein
VHRADFAFPDFIGRFRQGSPFLALWMALKTDAPVVGDAGE